MIHKYKDNGVLVVIWMVYVLCDLPGVVRLADDLVAEREKSKLLQEEMETTLHDIQNMWTVPRVLDSRPLSPHAAAI